jgi:hypothetical protein
MRMLKFNKKEMVDVVIAALTVKNAPRILGTFAPKFATGTTGNIASGILAYVVGMVLKKPSVSTVGLALALTNIVQDVAIDPTIETIFTGGAAALGARTRYPRLAEYTAAPRSSQNYSFVYNN